MPIAAKLLVLMQFRTLRMAVCAGLLTPTFDPDLGLLRMPEEPMTENTTAADLCCYRSLLPPSHVCATVCATAASLQDLLVNPYASSRAEF